MGRLSIQAEYRKLGLPLDPELDDQGHVDRLRDALIWRSLPLPELRAECAGLGAEVAGAEAAGDEAAARQECVRRLVASCWRDSWEAHGIPAERLASLEALDALLKAVLGLRALKPDSYSLQQECKKLGLPFDPDDYIIYIYIYYNYIYNIIIHYIYILIIISIIKYDMI
jgi:hypothetical protein